MTLYDADECMLRIVELEQELAGLKRELRKDWDHLKPYKMYKALREIASCESHMPGDVVDVARKALPDEELG